MKKSNKSFERKTKQLLAFGIRFWKLTVWAISNTIRTIQHPDSLKNSQCIFFWSPKFCTIYQHWTYLHCMNNKCNINFKHINNILSLLQYYVTCRTWKVDKLVIFCKSDCALQNYSKWWFLFCTQRSWQYCLNKLQPQHVILT